VSDRRASGVLDKRLLGPSTKDGDSSGRPGGAREGHRHPGKRLRREIGHRVRQPARSQSAVRAGAALGQGLRRRGPRLWDLARGSSYWHVGEYDRR